MSVENSIGDLKNVFRCLSKQRVLHYDPTFSSKIIYPAATLHNFRIGHRVRAADDYDMDNDSEAIDDDDDDDFIGNNRSRSGRNYDTDEDDEENAFVPEPNNNRNQHPGELFTAEGNRKRAQYIRNHFYRR